MNTDAMRRLDHAADDWLTDARERLRDHELSQTTWDQEKKTDD